MLPVEKTRISSNEGTQNHNDKLLISINIRQRDDPFQLSGKEIIKDLDTLIKNKWITAVSRLDFTSMFDEEFGCIKRSKSSVI